MAYFQLKSDNPNLSYVIHKAPDNLIARSIRKGVAYGWLKNDVYNIYFRDAENDSSFSEASFEYLDSTRYNSAAFPLSAISLFFASALKDSHEHDSVGFNNQAIIHQVFLTSPNILNVFSRYFSNFQIEIVEICSRNYQITIKTKENIKSLLNFVALMSLLNSTRGELDTYIDSGQLIKYANVINYLNAPYFIRYLFKINFTFGREFDKFKSILDTDSIKLAYGDNFVARRDFIKSKVGEGHIVDIGCGDGRYVTYLSGSINKHQYIAIDIDENCLDNVRSKVKDRQLENVAVYSSIESFLENCTLPDNSTTVICTEVIEHIEYNDSLELVNKVLKQPFVKSMLITTPCKKFNVNYAMDKEFRHDDHKFELDSMETWVLDLGLSDDFEATYYQVGDVVNNIATSFGLEIRRKRK